ncbi:IclR family transcriptional regulator [Amycolatopsis sp. WQ 127309]|uniref:IclR family transcriptional regulator n=1 Tax=Amycolatopsis sp. WQ 127309 TaxID=2932773 RepID=UPI001FF5D11F|nr:IclR family transcriptional regulator [Amycolatopsis sp. WQ 127309]UOZ06963.1 IclR family transcriptional regulator [Amycolatopsis sp. WQ 127309]
MSPSSRDDAPPGRAGALDRAAQILGAFTTANRELTLDALVLRCGLPRSTTHRTADTMIRLDWLEKTAGRYRIGKRLFELSGLAPVRLELRETVLPYLQDLYGAVNATVQLGVLDVDHVLVVEKITGHRPMPMLSPVGGSVPAHCSALGRAILAFSPPAVVDKVIAAGLEAQTERTITTASGLKRELAAAADRGWSVEHEEGNVGVTCVGAPIFGPRGDVAAALSVTGPSELLRTDRAVSAVRTAAAGASRAYRSRPAAGPAVTSSAFCTAASGTNEGDDAE